MGSDNTDALLIEQNLFTENNEDVDFCVSSKVMATFRVEKDLWDRFVEKARSEKTTATNLLNLFCRKYNTDFDESACQEDVDPIQKLLLNSKGHVLYFIQTDSESVKIGSASDLENFKNRFRECQRWISNPKLIGFAFCDRKVEGLIHNLLFSYRLPSKGRELFALEHEVKQHISNWCDWNIYDNSESFEDYLADLEDQDDDD